MAAKIRIFLDTSVIFAGIWSDRGGSRMLHRLGEAGAVTLLTSGLALKELGGAIREKAPQSLGALALLLDRAQFSIVGAPAQNHLVEARMLLDHPADALILSSALGHDIQYFVTLDQQHFLGNERLATGLPFRIGTPGECLEWIRRRLRRLIAGESGRGSPGAID